MLAGPIPTLESPWATNGASVRPMDDRRDFNPSRVPQPPAKQPAGASVRPPIDFNVDVRERGAEKDGVPQEMDRRLFFQLLAVRTSLDAAQALPSKLLSALRDARCPAVVYEDVNDPSSVAVLTFSEDPAHFSTTVRRALGQVPGLTPRPELSMLGRTYSNGHEQDLPYWLLDKPKETVLEEKWPWAIWYPLRRTGAFAALEPREQGRILKEHAIIGRAYGAKDLAHDVRLACHGLDSNDNEFVIGLIGKDLHPLSHVVQTMRKTRQTSEFIEKMGPFFVGHVVGRSH